jgi:hypothetical protein
VARSILETAYERAEATDDLASLPPEFGAEPFLRKLGLTGNTPQGVAWTPDLIDRGLALYAGYARESPDRFRGTVLIELEGWAEGLARMVRRLEGEATAVARLLDGGKDGRRRRSYSPATAGTSGSPSTSGTCTACSPRCYINWSGSKPGGKANRSRRRRWRT